MPTLDSPQFKDYAFRAYKSKYGTTAAVARQYEGLPGEYEPLGSLSIHTDRFRNQENQENINRGGGQHGVDTEGFGRPDRPGQLRWSGGNFESDNPHVGWAGMRKDVPGHSRLMMGLGAVLVHEHGSMPAADTALSETGARLARGAARKYGMKPGAGNPEMKARFDSMDASVAREAESAWSITNPTYNRGGERTGVQYTAAQAGEIVKAMDERYRLQPESTNRIHIHRGQQKLL